MKIGDISPANNLGNWPLLLIVSDRPEQGLIWTDVKLGLLSKQGRKTCLRIEINSENTITMKRKILGQVRRRGRLSAAALEIHYCNDLQLLALDAVRAITARPASSLVKLLSDLMNVIDGITAAPVPSGRREPLSFSCDLAQIPLVDANQASGLRGTKMADYFFRLWRKRVSMMGLQLGGQLGAMPLN